MKKGKASSSISLANPGRRVGWGKKLHCPLEQESYAKQFICMAVQCLSDPRASPKHRLPQAPPGILQV